MSEFTKVEVGGETFHFRDKLPANDVAAIRYNVAAKVQEAGENISSGEVMAIMSEGYLLFGLAKWSLKRPLSRAAIREEVLENLERRFAVANFADNLYQKQVLVPLVRAAEKSSPNGQTNGSISPTTDSGPSPRKRSKRSSTSTSPMDSTEEITPALVSGSSS